MRRGLFILLVVFFSFSIHRVLLPRSCLLTYDGAVHEYTGNIFSLLVNGDTQVGYSANNTNGRPLVPVRAIFEKLGAQVFWDATEEGYCFL